jgi:hypothetical protein
MYRVFISVLFTIIHDAAGLFSATPTIIHVVKAFPEDWQNIMLVVIPVVFIDCGSEILLVWAHDLPLCEKRPFATLHMRIALAGQILTSIIWFTLFILVAYFGVFNQCPVGSNFVSCPALIPGISSAIVVFMVFIKNSMTLKEYRERVYKYPVICHESLLFLYHFIRDDPKAIVEDFKNFNGLDENWESTCTTEPTYNAVINFATLILTDIAAIASVSNLIIVPGDDAGQTFGRAIPFVILVLADIGSEVLILVFHDIPLCNQEEEVIKENVRLFQAGRFGQIVVQVAWIIALIYMIHVVQTLDCNDICECNVYNLERNCTVNNGQCPINCAMPHCMFNDTGRCLTNNTIAIPNYPDFQLSNCSIKVSALTCQQTHPSAISCVLLALILFEGIYQTIGIFFKSYLLPITLPDSIMFQLYWMNGDQDKLITRLGQNEFGFHWHKRDADKILTEEQSLLKTEST